ncbi:MAG: SIS domain-containing protein [Pseudonocardiaceae bacterium]|nr:SIS domain-containing protein [Pseudonocardiaceae bacterium]
MSIFVTSTPRVEDVVPDQTTPGRAAGTVLAGVRAMLPALQSGDARVARAVLDDPEATIYRSVNEVAELAGTSTATVVRCAQKLGFRGFQQFKVALAREYASFAEPSTAEAGQPTSALERITAMGAQTVRDAGTLVAPESFDAAVSALHGANRALLVGVGTSAPLVQDAAYRFRVVGLDTEAPADVHMQHVSARLLRQGDVCLGVSHSGATRETADSFGSANSAGATTVLITSFLRSPLAELADVVLTAGTREVSFRLEAMASRLAHLAVLDALVIAVADRDPARAETALDHYADVVAEHRP